MSFLFSTTHPKPRLKLCIGVCKVDGFLLHVLYSGYYTLGTLLKTDKDCILFYKLKDSITVSVEGFNGTYTKINNNLFMML